MKKKMLTAVLAIAMAVFLSVAAYAALYKSFVTTSVGVVVSNQSKVC